MKTKLLTAAIFAVAMAWVEAATVLDLRVLVGRLQPYQPNPLPNFGGLGRAELVREGATLLMLLIVGRLAGQRRITRLAYSAFAFGLWDIFYYLFLLALTGWPGSLLDWDILFLIPVPWWGPVIAPVAVSLLMMVGGALAVLLGRFERPACRTQWSWLAAPAGIGLVLYSFMETALRASAAGLAGAFQVLPSRFDWIAFLPGLALMAVPVADMARRWFESVRKEAALS
jgi:hypothetical protein